MAERAARVRDYLAVQVEALRVGELALREGTPGSVHDTRVAVRRIRSLLRIFPALDPGDGLEERLRGWSDALGDVRDLEVLRETLAGVCSEALWDRLRPDLDAEHAAAAARLQAALDSAEHRELTEALRDLALREPDGHLHPGHAIRRSDAKARQRLEEADGDPDLLHRARKAAKRARYAAEAVSEEALAGHHEQVQDALGVHHDCVVALERLAGMSGADAGAARAALEARAAEALSEV